MRAEQTRLAGGERWLSFAEIADQLGIERDTVFKWIERKRMPALKLGKLWKFKASEIDSWARSGGSLDD